MVNWKEVDYARLIGWTTAFGLKGVDGGGKLQLKPRHRTATTVASLARSWTPTRPPDVHNYKDGASSAGFALAQLGWRDAIEGEGLAWRNY